LEYYKYRDPVHAFIRITPLENKIIDSLPFQRLRNVKQLAMTNLVYHGAEHTRFGHSIGVMHLVTKAFRTIISKGVLSWSEKKIAWYEQILRLVALTHDLGHAPFSHASEAVFPDKLEHEDFTEKIIKETCVAEYINDIGKECKNTTGYNITPDLICDIYTGKIAGENSEFVFLRSFMDSELDCDKMDYLFRDSIRKTMILARFQMNLI
jgi:HD superfamily phosphohydrolase